MEVLKTVSYTDILLVVAQHGVEILAWILLFATIGILMSILLIRKLRKGQWLKRTDRWRFVIPIHYVLIPLTVTGFLAYSGFLFGCKQAGKAEVNRARVVLEKETKEVFIERYVELMDTNNLRLGAMDTLAIKVIRDELNVKPGSFSDRSARYVIHKTRWALLLVLTHEVSDVYGIRRRYLNKIQEAYESEDAPAMHKALLDMFEYLSWKPFKAFILGSLLSGLGIALLVLLFPFIEIFYNGRKYKQGVHLSGKS